MAHPNQNHPARKLRALLAEKDVRAALMYLNSLTAYRFSALYRFDQEVLSNRYFFDRENPDLLATDDVPVAASYCLFVRDTRNSFAISNSLEDERVAAHPKRSVVRSYCGVPLVDEQGHMFGSVCHFDFVDLPVDKADVDLLEEVAALLLEAEQTAGSSAAGQV